MRVLVIPEDSRKDKDVLKPLFESLFTSIGKPKARIQVCENPVLGGVVEALKSERIEEIVKDNEGMTDIFILCVDRDGKAGRRGRLSELEAEFGIGRIFFAENAWEEIETWVLAGLNLPSEWRWTEVRAEVEVKERYFEPFASQRGVAGTPGGGRKPLAEEAARNIPAIRRKCPEDFDVLAQRLATHLQSGGAMPL